MPDAPNPPQDDSRRDPAREPAPGKPPPDMAALMLEIARIRREVEGSGPPPRRRGLAGMAIRLVAILALGWLLSQGPCKSLLQPSGIGDLETSGQATPRPVR